MKQVLCLLSLSLITLAIAAQENSKADTLAAEGVALHDKGDYNGAIARFDAAIALDPAHHLAIYEKSFSLMSLKKYEEAGELLKGILKNSKSKDLRLRAFVNYGTVLDLLDLPNESVKIYEQGIGEYPDHYLLHFNKGVTLMNLKKADEAAESFKRSVRLNPMHASSHNVLARMVVKNNRVAGVLALFTFLMVEPATKRSKDNLELLQQQMMLGVNQKDDKNIEISIDASSLDPKKTQDDDFSTANLALSLSAASGIRDKDSVDLTDADILQGRMETIIAIIDETKKKSGHFKTACYIAMATAGDEKVNAWLKANKSKLEDFFTWMKAYKW
jgi:tetratricopeptide (TPR) repeat protein